MGNPYIAAAQWIGGAIGGVKAGKKAAQEIDEATGAKEARDQQTEFMRREEERRQRDEERALKAEADEKKRRQDVEDAEATAAQRNATARWARYSTDSGRRRTLLAEPLGLTGGRKTLLGA